MPAVNFEKYEKTFRDAVLTKEIGKVVGVSGLLLKGYVPGCSVGSICIVHNLSNTQMAYAEVVGFQGQEVLLMSLGSIQGVGLGSKIVLLKTKATVSVGPELLGRVINGLGEPIDGKDELGLSEEVPLYNQIETPMKRELIRRPLSVGVRAI